MSTKSRLSRDQKRKAKLAKRAEKRPANEVLPYEGRMYQSDEWVPHVYQTELAIYETILLSQRRLTNSQVKSALVQLVHHLRAGSPALLRDDEPDVPFAAGNEVAHVAWNIRRHWGILVDEVGPVRSDDLTGILRTLLNSIVAHAWRSGPDRGYVDFLVGFMKRAPFALR